MPKPYRITKSKWEHLDGFANPKLFRKMVSNRWYYYHSGD